MLLLGLSFVICMHGEGAIGMGLCCNAVSRCMITVARQWD